MVHGAESDQDYKTGTHLKNNPGLLQQVGPHVSPDDVIVSAENYLDVLPEAAAIVIPGGFSISNGLMGKQGERGITSCIKGLKCVTSPEPKVTAVQIVSVGFFGFLQH